MFVSDEEVTALRAELERAKKDLARIRREGETMKQKKEYERLRRERSWGTSFDRQGGDSSADRRGTVASTIGSMWTRGVSTAADLEQSLTYVSRGIVPKLPVECSPSEYIAWEQRFEFFIANQGLRHTISLGVSEIAVISCTNNAYLFGQFGEELVLEHRQVWGYISDAAVDAPFENSLYKCHSISDALRMMREWSLPLYPAERHLLVTELERVQFMGDEESGIVQFILRQFSERPSHPHALVVGRGCRDGGAVGVGAQRRDNSMVSRGVGMPRQQQQSQQYWSRGGGMPQQQQQPQLQYWSRGGGIPHQHQRRSHVFPPTRQTRQPQPLQLPSRRIHTSGGDGDHGRNPLSPPATEAVPDTSVFPAASSKAVAEAPTSSAGAASTASGTVPSATPLREAVGARESSAGAASSDAISKAASTASGTVPSATPLREAVGARESSAGAASSDAVSKAAPATSGTVTSATPLRGAVGARESSSGAAPSDVAAEAFPLAVRYNINSNNSSNNIISSSNSRGNSSS